MAVVSRDRLAPCGHCGRRGGCAPEVLFCGGNTAVVARLLAGCVTAFGGPLPHDARGRIAAAIVAPSAQSWDAAHATIIHRSGRTLLEAVAAIHRRLPSRPPPPAPPTLRWPHVPGPSLIMLALEESTRQAFRA